MQQAKQNIRPRVANPIWHMHVRIFLLLMCVKYQKLHIIKKKMRYQLSNVK